MISVSKGRFVMAQDIVAPDSEKISLGGTIYFWRGGQLLDTRGRTVPLRAKSLQMFAALLERSGTVVSKDRLSDLVWPDVIATDESIARCIADIRKALGDRAHRIVETFPKQGYRLNVAAPSEPAVAALPRAGLVAVAGACVLTLISYGIWLTGVSTRAPDQALIMPASELREAVAILPFSSAEEDDRFLAAGLSDDLEVRLGDVSNVEIVSLVHSQELADNSASLVNIARELDARYIVTGRVRADVAEIAVSLQLTDAQVGTILWAGRYEGPREGLLAFRHDLPEQILEAMEVALDDRDRRRLSQEDTADPAAFEEVLRARRALSEFTHERNLAAEKYLRRAVARDPQYARAYAELAAALAIRLEHDWVVLSTADAEKAFYFADRALELDPDLWLAHYAMGRLHSIIPTGNTETALQHLRTAMSLQPANDDARIYYAVVTMMAGRPEEALPLFESVMATHPHPPFWYHLGLANTLFHLRRYEEATEAATACLWQMPNSPYCLRTLIATHARMGRKDDAEWYIVEYQALGHETTVESVMKSAIERDPGMRSHLRESYRMAGLD